MPRNQIAGPVSGGAMLPNKVRDRTPVWVPPRPPKQRRNQTAGKVTGEKPYLQLHTAQQGRPASSSKSSALCGNASAHARKPSPAAQVKSKKTKELEEAENEIRRLNELGLGDNVSHEEYRVYLKQLPRKLDVDICTKLDDVQLKELNDRHALYRLKYYQVRFRVVSQLITTTCYVLRMLVW